MYSTCITASALALVLEHHGSVIDVTSKRADTKLREKIYFYTRSKHTPLRFRRASDAF